MGLSMPGWFHRSTILLTIVTAQGTAAGIFDEFWPDLSRKFLHRAPTRGADVQPPPPINPKLH